MIKSSILALMLAASASGAAYADALVVRSSGPSARSYPPGKALPDNSRIVLKANDSLVILDGRGTRTLKGPGSFNTTQGSAAAAADSRSTFAALVTQRSERRARIGAVRGGVPSKAGAPAANRPPNIWFVDIERSSAVCVVDPAGVALWRSDASKAAAVSLTGPDGQSRTLNFAAGQTALAWPEAATISEGARYRITAPGLTHPTELRFALLGPGPEGLEDMAAALIRHDCTAQLDLLVETVAAPDPVKPAG